MRWKYFDNPAGPAGIAVAFDGEQMIGLMSAFAVPFYLDGRRFVASQMGHNDVSKPYRSNQVYFQLASTIFQELVDGQDVDFCYGIAIEQTRDLSTVLMGFHEVGAIGKLVKIINPVPHLRKAWKLPLPRSWGRLATLGKRRALHAALGEFTLAAFDHFEELALEEAPESVARSVMASRDPSYMEWRYVDCPLGIYEKLQLRKGGGLAGWAVYHRFDEQGVRYGVVDECFAVQEDCLGHLVLAVVGAFLERDVDAIVSWACPGSTLYRALLEQGFIRRPAPRSLIVRPLSDGVSESALSAERSWYYTIGDTEYWLFPVDVESGAASR